MRKNSESTKSNTGSPANTVLNLALAAMREELLLSRWYLTAPAKFRVAEPEITVVGVETRDVYTTIGGGLGGSAKHKKPFLVGQVVVGGISAKLALRLDFGVGGFVVEEGK